MNDDLISVQLAISKLHMQNLLGLSSTDSVATEALAELNTTLAELEATNEELLRSNSALAQLTVERDREAQRYRDLFTRMPIPCIATDEWGVIEETNAAADELLNVPPMLLKGKPISVFVPADKRREFRAQLDRQPLSEVWEAIMQPRQRDRITVQLDVVELPADGGHKHLCWVIQNLTPQRAAVSTEKLLQREVVLRMEAQAMVTRLRALHSALEIMQQEVRTSIPKRVQGMMELLVPRFARSMLCQFPGATEPALVVGEHEILANALEARIFSPPKTPGRLIARRSGPFTPEDHAILVSAANAVTALIASMAASG